MSDTRHIPDKVIRIPASLPVDVGAFLPVIDHALFQKLRGRRQLGVNHLVFPGAVHTRFEHTIGVLGLTQRVCTLQRMSVQDTLDLCMFALVHDVGHGPFSHQIEPVLGGCHHRRSEQMLDELKPEIESCGVDVQTLKRLFTGKDPRHAWVSDRNLGTDKLDYLQRDSLHIGFTGVPDIEQILLYMLMIDGTLAVEEKFTQEVKRLQKFYTYLHQHGYLNKTALSVQRMFQRSVEEELQDTQTHADRLWAMTDDELMRWLHQGCNPLAAQLMSRLETRHLHRTGMVIKPSGYAFVERTARKAVRVIEWSRAKLRAFCERMADPRRLRDLEDRVAAAAGLAPGEVLFAAMPYFDKLLPRDVLIGRRDGRHFQLFEQDKHHYNSLLGDYLSTFAIRLIVIPEKRDVALRCTPSMLGLLEEVVADWVRKGRGEIKPRRGELFE